VQASVFAARIVRAAATPDHAPTAGALGPRRFRGCAIFSASALRRASALRFPNPAVLIGFAANCYNSAFDASKAEAEEKGKLFSPQNWLKAKDSLLKLSASVSMYMGFMAAVPNGPETRKALEIPANRFSLRWAAD
jgi:hypothetical protein